MLSRRFCRPPPDDCARASPASSSAAASMTAPGQPVRRSFHPSHHVPPALPEIPLSEGPVTVSNSLTEAEFCCRLILTLRFRRPEYRSASSKVGHTSAFVPGCKPATNVQSDAFPLKASRHPMKIRKAVFPVAGLGTRVLPATKAMPKEMLTIVDKPLIQYVVDEAKEAGIEHFVFVTGRNKGVIEDHFDRMYELDATLAARGKKAEMEILARDQPEAGAMSFTRQQAPLGLGHAVWCARDIVGDEPFAVVLPDELVLNTPGCLKQMIEAAGKLGDKSNLIAVEEVPGASDASIWHLRRRQAPQARQHVRGRRHGGEAAEGHRAVQSLDHRALHPAAGDLQDPGNPGARRRRRNPAHRRDDRARRGRRASTASSSRASGTIAARRPASCAPTSPSAWRAPICATACAPR